MSMNSTEIARFAAQVLDAKKAEDIVVLDIREVTSLGDYFVIGSGKSTAQVKALTDELDEKFSAKGVEPRRIEGQRSSMWMLMDYGDVIIHVFYHETRDFYCLERLWADAKKVDWAAL